MSQTSPAFAYGIPADALARARRIFGLALRDGLDADAALAAASNDTAPVYRIEPHAVARALTAALHPAVAVVVTIAPTPEREPERADDADSAREALEVALDALHAAADVAEAGEDDAAHTRALRAMTHVLRALRALDGVSR